MSVASQTLDDFKGDSLSINMFGAVPDMQMGTDGTVSASTDFSSASTTFTAGDIGKYIWIEDLGGSADFIGTIAGLGAAHHVTLDSAPSFTAAGAKFRYFTDNTDAIQRAINVANSTAFLTNAAVRIYIPRGIYGITGSITTFSGTTIIGQGYAMLPYAPGNNLNTASTIVCCGNVPIFTNPNPQFSLTIEKVCLLGTSRTGSSGVSFATAFGSVYRDVGFGYFGNYAIFEGPGGTSSRLENVQTTSCWMAHSGLLSFVGVVDISTSDSVFDGCRITSSESYNQQTGASLLSGQIGTGFVAAWAIRGGNSFVHDCIGHGSEVGYYCGTTSGSVTTFVNCRSDENQGQAFVIDASNCSFIGCRAINNSWNASGQFSAFDIRSGGNRFYSCQVMYFTGQVPPGGPSIWQILNAFDSSVPGSSEACHFINNYIEPGVYANTDYNFQAGSNTAQVIIYPTGADPTGSPTYIVRGDLSVRNNDPGSGRLFIEDSTAGADQKKYSITAVSNGMQIGTWDDAETTPTVAVAYARGTGAGANSITTAFHFVPVELNSSIPLEFLDPSGTVVVSINCVNGTPTLSAQAGSLALDTNGHLWMMTSGSGWLDISQPFWTFVPPSGITTNFQVGINASPATGIFLNVGGIIQCNTLRLGSGGANLPVITDGSIDLKTSVGVVANSFVTWAAGDFGSAAFGATGTFDSLVTTSGFSDTVVTSVNFTAQTYTTIGISGIISITTDAHSYSQGLINI